MPIIQRAISDINAALRCSSTSCDVEGRIRIMICEFRAVDYVM